MFHHVAFHDLLFSLYDLFVGLHFIVSIFFLHCIYLYIYKYIYIYMHSYLRYVSLFLLVFYAYIGL